MHRGDVTRQYNYNSCDFQVIIEGVRGDNLKGDIAVDDISLTPGCKLFTGPLPAVSTSQSGMYIISHYERNSPSISTIT